MVLETAELAHLDLTEEELDSALPSFEQMIDFFALMMKADESAKTIHLDRSKEESPVGLIPRADNIKNSSASLTDTLISAAGESDGRFIIVPNVL